MEILTELIKKRQFIACARPKIKLDILSSQVGFVFELSIYAFFELRKTEKKGEELKGSDNYLMFGLKGLEGKEG